ncbi:MAG: hypothetical protein IJX63_10390 [Lachnospiraceae bacterium]|nr:hypothetical protein [Lachnospiraceae bacterium]
MKEPYKIKANDSWNQFLASGKVEDYLHYVAGYGGEDRFENAKTDRVGERPHAGVYRGNRNHIEADAYR